MWRQDMETLCAFSVSMWEEFADHRWIPLQWAGTADFDIISVVIINYNMTVWILAGNYISFTIAAGLIRLHMPGVKKSRV